MSEFRSPPHFQLTIVAIEAQVEQENFHQFKFQQLHKEKEMADFRKWLFAFAVVALMLGLQVPANAQGFGTAPAFACVANAGVPPIVRAEGVTELVGDLDSQLHGWYSDSQLAPRFRCRTFRSS